VYPLKNQSIEGHGDEEANLWPSARRVAIHGGNDWENEN
jgi:hypothetical protein